METPQKSFLMKAALWGVSPLGASKGIFILYVTGIEISREHFGEYKVDCPTLPLTFKDPSHALGFTVAPGVRLHLSEVNPGGFLPWAYKGVLEEV